MNTTKEKMHTIEISEQELARVLFVMQSINGKVYGKTIESIAYQKLGLRRRDPSTFYAKIRDLAETANLPKRIDYYSIQNEWESFLGIGDGVNYKEILDEIISLQRELVELKRLLCHQH